MNVVNTIEANYKHNEKEMLFQILDDILEALKEHNAPINDYKQRLIKNSRGQVSHDEFKNKSKALIKFTEADYQFLFYHYRTNAE